MTNRRQRKKKLAILRLREKLANLGEAVVEKAADVVEKVTEVVKEEPKEEIKAEEQEPKKKRKLSFVEKIRESNKSAE
jgi:hypothetical protein